MGVIGFDLGFTVFRWHAGEAWLAPLTIQAQIDANKSDLMYSHALEGFETPAPVGADDYATEKALI